MLPTGRNIKADSETFEDYEKEIENMKLHGLHIDDTNSDTSEIIKSLDKARDDIESAISKYGEIVKIQTEVYRLRSDCQKEDIYKNEIPEKTEFNRRSIGLKIKYFMIPIKDLFQVYRIFIEFGLKDIKTLSEMIADSSKPWHNIPSKIRMKILNMFNERLLICTDLLDDCEPLQNTAFDALTELKAIFMELKDDEQFDNFLNKFDKFMHTQKRKINGITGKQNKRMVGFLSHFIEKKPGRHQDLYNKRQKFNEIDSTNPLENILDLWNNYTDLMDSEEDNSSSSSEAPAVSHKRKRKSRDVSHNSMLISLKFNNS